MAIKHNIRIGPRFRKRADTRSMKGVVKVSRKKHRAVDIQMKQFHDMASHTKRHEVRISPHLSADRPTAGHHNHIVLPSGHTVHRHAVSGKVHIRSTGSAKPHVRAARAARVSRKRAGRKKGI